MTTIANEAEPSRLAFLDSLRGLAVIMVVAIHATGYVAALNHSERYILALLLTTIAVPVFFLVDGYLIVRASSRRRIDYNEYTKGSFKRLVVPWLIFTIGYTLSRLALELVGGIDVRLIVGEDYVTVLQRAYGSVFSAQLYFLLSLFFIRLIFPVVLKLVEIIRAPLRFAVGIASILLAQSVVFLARPYLSVDSGQEPLLHAFWGVQFYIAGALLASVESKLESNKAIFFVAAGVLVSAYLFLFNNLDIHPLFQMAVLILVFMLFKRFKIEAKSILYIGRNTMEIYILHAPILLKAVALGVLMLSMGSLLQLSLIVIITLIASMLTAGFIKKIPGSGVLFGKPQK